MKCWNCRNNLDEVLLCGRCGMPQPHDVVGPFEALGLPPRLQLRRADLEDSFLRLAQRCHPDLFWAHRDERVLTAARLAMRGVNDAYRALQQPMARLRYILSAIGWTQETTRTVPEGLQESAQIIDRALRRAEEAHAAGDREAWEAQQDHIASLQVQVEKARERSDEELHALFSEWDASVATAGDDWPEMPSSWFERAHRWMGEREYLLALTARVQAARDWPPAGAEMVRQTAGGDGATGE